MTPVTDNSEPTKDIESLIEAYTAKPLNTPDGVARITISDIAQKVASFYERIRNMVDFREEHLLRKNAIKRFLKRRLLLSDNTTNTGLPLIEELIQAKYLPNDYYPETYIPKVEKIIERYVRLQKMAQAAVPLQDKLKIRDWIFSLASCELEEFLSPSAAEEKLAESVFKYVKENTIYKDDNLSDGQKSLITYIAVHRALLRVDNDTIHYRLIKLSYPHMFSHKDEDLQDFAKNALTIKNKLTEQSLKRINPKLARFIEKKSVIFMILRTILINPKAAEILSNPSALKQEVRQICADKYAEDQAKLRRSAIRSLIYIFLTKMAIALVLEMPLDVYLTKQLLVFPLVVNLLFPPLLMFAITFGIHVPGEENTERIIAEIQKIVYNNTTEEKKIMRTVKLSRVYGFIFSIIYILLFGLIIGGVSYGLTLIGFSPISIVIFLFFLCVISFFAIRIRKTATELLIKESKENVYTFIRDLIATPIIRAGRWIAMRSTRLNFFVYILDFLIEAPFKALVAVLEKWVSFLRDKKEDIY